ncbi:unknown [Methanoculleus sp. CAG:1088]|nr:unknown [Methanoculleus sp. CAG:1088]
MEDDFPTQLDPRLVTELNRAASAIRAARRI